MWLWRGLGGAAFLLGAIGLVLPVWPTTIFWILAAACFTKSAPAWRDWIYARPGFGPMVEGFLERGVLAKRAKRGALFGLAISTPPAAWAVWDQPAGLGAVVAVLATVAAFIATLPED
ncbi:MAG: YbaN family protein [Pseudomonadota bacterium]